MDFSRILPHEFLLSLFIYIYLIETNVCFVRILENGNEYLMWTDKTTPMNQVEV